MPKYIFYALISIHIYGYAQVIDNSNDKFGNSRIPTRVEKFNPVFHFPPVNQDTTFVCWSFSTISFIETEMKRLRKTPVKLAVMFPVYYAFIEKAKYFVKTKGKSRFSQGDLFGTVLDVIKKYGIVPAQVYKGHTRSCDTYNHDQLYSELHEYISKIKEKSLWDEQKVISGIKTVLNKHLGKPPDSFKFNGREYTPVNFRKKVINLKWQDYVKITSFEYSPFNNYAALKVPDNWQPDSSFFNVDLDVFYNSLIQAVKSGYSVVIDGDMSEPGRIGSTDVCIIPDFDIPSNAISQKAREYRFENGLTTDDHLMHIIGYQNFQEKDWFLVKDSWRDAFEGKHKGYFFFSDDFIKLKVLAYLVHKDAVPEILKLQNNQN